MTEQIDQNEEPGAEVQAEDAESVEDFIKALQGHGIECSPVQSQPWGMLTEVRLPGGGKLGVYQPRHARPPTAKLVAVKKKSGTSKSKTRRSKTARKAVRKPRGKRSRRD